jgi:pimeloyl-ACP methyl ester carboxylesterase
VRTGASAARTARQIGMSTPPHRTSSPPGAPVEECWATVDGARMRYLRAGSGPPLVLLHGLLGYSFSWRFTIPAQARHSTVFAVDSVGTGFSDRVPDLDCSFPGSARRLLQFLDQVGVSECDLLGTSHGGAIAMMAASLAPQRVKRLILVAPVNPWSAHGRHLAGFLSSAPVVPLLLYLAPRMEFTHRIFLRRVFGDPKRIPPGTLEGYSAPMKIPNSFDYGVNVLRNWRSGLRELSCALSTLRDTPTLLIWGDRDPAVDPASAPHLRQHFDHCRLVMLQGVGHLPYEEVPDVFNQALREFLNSSGTA